MELIPIHADKDVAGNSMVKPFGIQRPCYVGDTSSVRCEHLANGKRSTTLYNEHRTKAEFGCINLNFGLKGERDASKYEPAGAVGTTSAYDNYYCPVGAASNMTMISSTISICFAATFLSKFQLSNWPHFTTENLLTETGQYSGLPSWRKGLKQAPQLQCQSITHTDWTQIRWSVPPRI